MRIAQLRIGQKLVLVLLVAILIAFLVALLAIDRISRRFADDAASELARTLNGQVLTSVDVFARELEASADRLGGALAFGFPERFRVDEGATTRMGERAVPNLYNGNRLVNHDVAFVDRFAQQTHALASVFVREGDDFVRVTTSLKKEDGSRVVGTPLGPQHPATARLLAGEEYRGMARLFGREYFAKYIPIKDGAKVIGALFVGVDFTDALAKLKERLRTIRLGETGYVFVINTRREDADYGFFAVHPSLEGKNALELNDARGLPVMKEIVEKAQGEVRYLWKRGGSSAPSESLAAIARFDEFGWVIATRADVDELSKGVYAVEKAVLVVALILLIALPLLVYVVAQRLVSRPLARLQEYCAAVERNHDFTLAAPGHSGDEVGQTVESVSALLQTLRQTFGGLLGAVRRVEEASNAMSASARENAHNSGTASDAASAMAASVEQLSVGINQISDNANDAARLSNEAGERSNEGGKTILAATGEMSEIATTVQNTATAITELGQETRQISGIVSVIKEVAEQTNLLALNAAIEAARAGEAGRGFAVVADEVRKLAERTTHATAEIAGVIGSIQQRAEQAVSAMSGTVEQVQRGTDLANQAGEAINEIRRGSERVVDVVRLITEALQESSAASHSMANQTEKVAEVAEDSNHAAKQASEAAGNLEQLTRDMRNTISHFRI